MPTTPQWSDLSKPEQNALVEIGLKENWQKRVQRRHLAYARLAARGLLAIVKQWDVFVIYQLTDSGQELLRTMPDHLPGRTFLPIEADIQRLKQRLPIVRPPDEPDSREIAATSATDNAVLFSPTHHALLFGWISREVIRRVGVDPGESALRQAVRRYGEQRGQRMALRALANGHPLTMTYYRVYGEWQADPGLMTAENTLDGTNLLQRIRKCPWQAAWAENDLVAYGRLYCLEIDQALARGFNPELQVTVNSTQSNGAPYCEFIFHAVDSSIAPDTIRATDGAPLLEWGGRVLPWEYHLGHLYQTMNAVMIGAFGAVGAEALSVALAEFGRRFGDAAAQRIRAYAHTDFNQLPD